MTEQLAALFEDQAATGGKRGGMRRAG